VLAASLNDGILMLGVGAGQSKVFELFDRHALGGVGHPADIEKIRQAAIDAAHMEAFTRAPEDVSLRRLIAFGLSPQLKTAFEQIFAAPFLIELLLAEIAEKPAGDLLVRLHFDGSFDLHHGGVAVCGGSIDSEEEACRWLVQRLDKDATRTQAGTALLETWARLQTPQGFSTPAPEVDWRALVGDRTVEIGWLSRTGPRAARYQGLALADLNL
jgi:proteasome alpha subunit